ncbi:MAG: N-acetylneuraminate synthase family protein [Planctomycetota bacterium]|nr:N-acetylneuraminate synthase family protein [Planctomycetota bacterium]
MSSPRTLLDVLSNRDPYIIAEIGVNHDGSRGRAEELIRAAADAGADAVKFQWFDPIELLSTSAGLVTYQERSGESDAREMLGRLQLSSQDLRSLVDSARRLGLQSLVTVFTPRLVDPVLEFGWNLLKVASPDLVNRPLLEALRAGGLPMLASTGGATLEEIQQAVEWIGAEDLALLHCVSSYPTEADDASLAAIRTIADATGLPVGYSDHTRMVETGALAVAAGATILEKHLTWNSSAPGPDHAASMDPDEFQTYVRLARTARRMLGSPEKRIQRTELDVISASRQSVSVIDEVLPGDVLSLENLTTMRPGDGLPPACLKSLVGRRVTRRIAPRSHVSLHDLESESSS